MKFLLQVTLIEIRRELQQARAYLVDVIADQILFTLGFLLLSGLFHLVAEGSYTDSSQLALLVGFVVWRVADGCMLNITRSMREDAQWGTLEQLWLSPIQPYLILGCRAIAILLYHSGRALLIVLIAVPVLRLTPAIRPGGLLIFFLTQIAAFGLAFIIIGLHLVYKNVSSIMVALSTILVFATGALTPLSNDTWLYAVARLLPLTIGIDLLRQMTVNGLTLSAILGQPDFYWLIVQSTFYGLLGIAMLQWGQKAAREQGTLAHY